MSQTIETLNFILAVGGIAMIFTAGVLLFDFYSKNKTLEKIVTSYGLLIAFFVTAGSTVMTLIYSEVFGFVPCGLCWLQRVCLYPQVVILGLALYTKDKTAAKYGIALSIPGIVVSLYQHYLQMGGTELVTCPISSADCAERILFEFGFMTFPLMSTFLFIFLIALYIYILKTNNWSKVEQKHL